MFQDISAELMTVFQCTFPPWSRLLSPILIFPIERCFRMILWRPWIFSFNVQSIKFSVCNLNDIWSAKSTDVESAAIDLDILFFFPSRSPPILARYALMWTPKNEEMLKDTYLFCSAPPSDYHLDLKINTESNYFRTMTSHSYPITLLPGLHNAKKAM